MIYHVFYYVGGPAEAYTLTPENVDPKQYKHMASVEVTDAETPLEYIFRRMNTVDGSKFEISASQRIRSMSVGDVVVASDGRSYLCAMVGWQTMNKDGFVVKDLPVHEEINE